jgi:hypothetical protein
MGYQATTEVEVISPEIQIISEADVFCVMGGSIHTTISLNPRSWNIARSLRTWQDNVSLTGSKTQIAVLIIALKAKEDPKCKFTSLVHLLTGSIVVLHPFSNYSQ